MIFSHPEKEHKNELCNFKTKIKQVFKNSLKKSPLSKSGNVSIVIIDENVLDYSISFP